MRRKLVLVTGGSRGLGKNAAIKLARNGLDVIITYNTKEREAREVVEMIEGMGCKAAALYLDVGDVSSFDSFFGQVAEVLRSTFDTDRFDYLINNAGISLRAPFEDTTEALFDQVLNIQFKGTYFFTQKALAQLNDGGGIVNISSRLSRACTSGYSVYASMKGAIDTLTIYQAKELSPRRIRVNAVAPGPIATDFGGGGIRDNPQHNAYIKAATALGRVGEPDDIGGVVAFLCTEDARWITAQRIEVSGGMNL